MPNSHKNHTTILLGALTFALFFLWLSASAAPSFQQYLPLVIRPLPTLDHLLITEIMANPTAGQGSVEWIEIYNPTGVTVDLTGYKIGDSETINDNSEAMRQFPAGAAIAPWETLVLANDANAFQTAFGFLPDYEITNTGHPVPDLFPYVPWATGAFNLSNNGDEILLLNVKDEIVDSVAWGNSTWTGFDLPAMNPPQGSTLERHPPHQDTDTAQDWRAQTAPNPGGVDLGPTSTPTLTLTSTLSPTPTMTPTPFTGLLLISEVLYDPIGDEPDAEWIEIFNPSGQTIDLTNFKIGDEETSGQGEGMYRFPDGTLMQDGEIFVIANQATVFSTTYGLNPDFELVDTSPAVPDMVKYTAWSNGSMNLANTGDEVLILDPGDGVVDAVSWGSSTWAFAPSVANVSEGHSIERVPADQDTNTNADWVDQAHPAPGNVTLTPSPTATLTPTPTLSPTPTMTPTPFTGLLLISEVLYDPVGDEPDAEWIEIFNPSGQTIDLTNFKIGDEETSGQGEGMYRFPDGTLMQDGEIFVIANQATVFSTTYGLNPDFELVDTSPAVPDMVKYTAWSNGSMNLANTGDEVLILDPGDGVVDAVSWGSSTWAFAPSVANVSEGHSIERVPADQDTNTNADWVDQPVPDPGDVDI